MHMQNPDSEVLRHVGENLRRLRNAAGLSQSALADASGVSRRTIISLEAGNANVSLSSLDRLAHAVGATFVTLVASPETSPAAINETTWRGASAASAAILRGTAPARREAQLWSWSLDEGERYEAEPDPEGWHEMILVTQGSLQIIQERDVATLVPGEHLIFSSAQRYSYANVGTGVATFLRVVTS
jgi:transcriptional regulator with XRE-family HTH domain